MSSLIRRVTSEAGIGYGVNVMEIAPPGAVQGVKTTVVAIVANLPWGPTDTVTDVGTVAEFFDTFAPAHFGFTSTSWPALLAFVNKAWPGPLKVVRISPSSHAAATYSWVVTGGNVIATATRKGTAGNSISVAWTAATDAVSTHRDVTVAIGTTYSATYKNVSISDITQVDDPYVDFTLSSSPTVLPNAGVTNSLASGGDGTPAASDFVGSISSAKGMQLFASAAQEFAVLFCAGVASGILDSVNDGLLAFVQAYPKCIAVLSTVDGQSKSAAATYAADYRSDRIFYPWPRVKTLDAFDADLAEAECDGAPFAACAIASVDPWRSPGGEGGRPFLTGVTGLEDETFSLVDIDTLNEAGIGPFFMGKKGCIIARAVTTSLTSGLEKLHRRRMTDYLSASISEACEDYVELPLDLTLSSHTLGNNTGALVGRINQFLADLQGKPAIRSFVVDPFGGCVQADIDAGRWTILVTVQLLSMMEEIVLRVTAGERVNIVTG